MKIVISNRHLFLLALLLVLIVNIIVLSGVASNRSGEPDFEGSLTERELGVSWNRYDENSGVSFRLNWRTEQETYYHYGYYYSKGTPSFLNEEKMIELGFQTDNNYKYGYNTRPPKEVFIVLEYEGESYRTAVVNAEKIVADNEKKLSENPEDKDTAQKLKRAKENLAEEKNSRTRLFAIDAGLESEKLRERYQDRAKYIISKGVVTLQYYSGDKDKKNTITGYIRKLSIEKIHVPLTFKKELETILNNKNNRRRTSSPKYKVELAYGKRFEPYIISVKKTGE